MTDARRTILLVAVISFLNFHRLTRQTDAIARALEGFAATEQNNKFGRILLYLTTHMSETHFWYLQACWPQVLLHSSLLRNADVMVYLSASESVRERAIQQLNDTFQEQNLKIHAVDNPGWQEGSMAALYDATRNKWFAGYDWVIRLNPDVIVRNDTFLVETITNDTNATALLANCKPEKYMWGRHSVLKFLLSWEGPLIQTDFFALKPSVLPPNAFLNLSHEIAEISFTTDIRESILDKGGHRFIPGAGPVTGVVCRLGHGRALDESPIVHHHFEGGEENNITHCPISF